MRNRLTALIAATSLLALSGTALATQPEASNSNTITNSYNTSNVYNITINKTYIVDSYNNKSYSDSSSHYLNYAPVTTTTVIKKKKIVTNNNSNNSSQVNTNISNRHKVLTNTDRHDTTSTSSQDRHDSSSSSDRHDSASDRHDSAADNHSINSISRKDVRLVRPGCKTGTRPCVSKPKPRKHAKKHVKAKKHSPRALAGSR